MALGLKQYIIAVFVLMIISFIILLGIRHEENTGYIIDNGIIQLTKDTTIADSERKRMQKIRKLINNNIIKKTNLF